MQRFVWIYAFFVVMVRGLENVNAGCHRVQQ